MTPPRPAVRDLALRLTVTDPLVPGPHSQWPSWEAFARAAAGRTVILELGGVTRMDAAGLGLLVAFAEAVRLRGGCLQLSRVQPQVRRMVEVTGLAEAVGLHTAAT